jgi:hypothetical protein
VIWRRQRQEERPRRQADDDLAAWLAAEAVDDDAGAEVALGALFSALPPVEPPPGLAQRVLRETVWAVDATPAEAARGWWRAAAVLAGLAAMTVFAGGALAPKVIARLDPAAAVAGALAGLLAVAHAFGAWVATGVHLLDVLPWLGSMALLVASSPQVVAALVIGSGLFALAIKILHQVVERDRRHSYVEAS